MDNNLSTKGMKVEYATISVTIMGAIAALALGTSTSSIALTGFGLDSVIAAISAGIFLLLRLFRRRRKEQDDLGSHGTTERRILFAAGVLYFLLTLYLLNESGSRLFYGEKPEATMAGVILAVLLLICMGVLTVIKMRVATASKRLFRDYAGGTSIRAFLSLVLLLGLSLNARLGWWWADPAAAVLMLPLIVREGWEAFEASKQAGRSQVIGMSA